MTDSITVHDRTGESVSLLTTRRTSLVSAPVEPPRPRTNFLDTKHAVQRPRIPFEDGPHVRFVRGFDSKECDVLVASAADWPTDDDDSSLDQRIREGRVLRPRFLITYRASALPVGPLLRGYCEDSRSYSFAPLLIEKRLPYDLTKARRSWLIASACVVHMPCG
jgi:hypothetical protein